MTTLVIATKNRHKAEEIRSILGGGVRCLTLQDLPGAPSLVEDADTFAGNATRKAEQLASWIAGSPQTSLQLTGSIVLVLADDSGLEVDALDGAPGVYSARFAAVDKGASGNSSDAENNAKLLRLLTNVPLERRTARFRCALALLEVPTASRAVAARVFEGACEGRIQSGLSGTGGFGYDPLFVPEGFTQSFAELGEGVKNQISHRARALRQLRTGLGIG